MRLLNIYLRFRRAAVFPSLILLLLSSTGSSCAPTGNDKPKAPAGLAVEAISVSEIVLNWLDRSDNEDGFNIERSTSSSSGYTQVGQVDAGVTTLTLSDVNPSLRYYYRVYAWNGKGDSDPSNAVRFMIYGTEVGHVVEDFSLRDQNNVLVELFDYEEKVILMNFSAEW